MSQLIVRLFVIKLLSDLSAYLSICFKPLFLIVYLLFYALLLHYFVILYLLFRCPVTQNVAIAVSFFTTDYLSKPVYKSADVTKALHLSFLQTTTSHDYQVASYNCLVASYNCLVISHNQTPQLYCIIDYPITLHNQLLFLQQ